MTNPLQTPASQPPLVLFVDDEADELLATRYLLEAHGIAPVATLEDPREAQAFVAATPPAMIILDLIMPHLPGQQLLTRLVRDHPSVPVVVMTASQDVETAIACMKEGAFDYLVKPVEESRLVSSVRHALEVCALRRHIGVLRHTLLNQKLKHPEAFASILTRHGKMISVFQYIEAIAESPEPALITGETGVGKEMIAEAIHRLSRRPGRLVTVNVAGLDDTLFSDTLFGHMKGAFSGAEKDREGLITQAAEGTLFLDEIGDLTPASQVKLLRLLQDGTYYPLGSDIPKLSRARIVAATNRNLQQLMTKGSFRQDLFFRLSSHPLEIPPLRKRADDLPLLIDFFLQEASAAMDKPGLRVPEELYTLLSVYHFPGNVRELRALIFNAVAKHRFGAILSMESFKEVIQATQRSPRENLDDGDGEGGSCLEIPGRFPTLKDAEDFLIQEAMRRGGNNQGIAATLLGISRQTLNYRLSTRRRES
ncbi:MAG: sigma-54-dependent Fis family transcriptional regulator [Magnetococcales bacterium]|nr:sigma-54-dependent Fis family transcriptional regulator [Magnetococcales bacterium]